MKHQTDPSTTHTLSTIGHQDPSINYINRPTVKVLIQKGSKVLLLNQGLLPGGGVDPGESDLDAITRELQEELGATVKDVRSIGAVVQYRNLLGKRYIINGYRASLNSIEGQTNPQDEGEAQFTLQWLTLEEAIAHVTRSIEDVRLQPMDDDRSQGGLYNLMTTLEFLKANQPH